MIHGLGGLDEVGDGLTAAASGTYMLYANVRPHPCTEVMLTAFKFVYIRICGI